MAVGAEGRVWFSRGESWTELHLPMPDLIDACFLPNGTAMICGEQGSRALLDLKGRTVEIFHDPVARETVFDIAACGARVHVVTEGGALLSWSPAAGWSTDRPEGSATFIGLACSGDTIWCVETFGRLMVQQSGAWQTIDSDFTEDLYSACVFSSACYVGGEEGVGRVKGAQVVPVWESPSDRVATDNKRLYSVRDNRIAWTRDGAHLARDHALAPWQAGAAQGEQARAGGKLSCGAAQKPIPTWQLPY